MQLEEVPRIIPILVKQGVVTSAEQGLITNELQKGDNRFAGQIALDLNIITPEQLNNALLQQVLAKAEAAVPDIQMIRDKGTQEISPQNRSWLKANWGNNGVNPAIANPTKVDAVAAIANIAQNMVMLANNDPALAKDLVEPISAAANLARGIAGVADEKRAPLNSMWYTWLSQVEDGLKQAALKQATSGVSLKSTWSDQEINIDDYITARFSEINAGIRQTLQPQPITQQQVTQR